MSTFWGYKSRARKDEISCADCIHSCVRWWSGRYCCSLHNGYAVSKKGTCPKAEKIKEDSNE